MKYLLFVTRGMGVGGIERCLLNLLKNIDYAEYSVDLLIMQREYEFLDMVDPRVRILEQYQYVMTPTETIGEFSKIKAPLLRYFKYVAYRLVNKYGKQPWIFFEKNTRHYDAAIAYGINGFAPQYVIEKVKADKTILWHHNGKYIHNGTKRESQDREYFPKFDQIICVSNQCKEDFVKNFPELMPKTTVVVNYLDTDTIDAQKLEFVPAFSNDVVNLVTVGRMSDEKGPDLMIDAAKILVERSINFHWYWCGDGNAFNRISQRVTDECLGEFVTLLGNCINPYPYMDKCDVYVQPSRYEGYCTTTNEAKYLCKPIVTTDVGGVREQFTEDHTAVICRIDAADMADKIQDLINSRSKREELEYKLVNQKSDINFCANKYREYLQ